MKRVWMFSEPQQVTVRDTATGPEVTILGKGDNEHGGPLVLIGDRGHILAALRAAANLLERGGSVAASADVPDALRHVVDVIAESNDKDEIAALVMAVATGAADATAENCARALEGVIPEVGAAFPVPPGQVAVAPLSAVFQMIRGLAGGSRETKSNPAAGAP